MSQTSIEDTDGMPPTMLWWTGSTPIKKKRSENLAPRIAPRIGFSYHLGRECNSESCSENGFFTPRAFLFLSQLTIGVVTPGF